MRRETLSRIFLIIVSGILLCAAVAHARPPLVWDTGKGTVESGRQAAGKAAEKAAPGIGGGSLAGMAVIAFAAGILSFLSPCTLPILPAYFAFTFQSDRRRIVFMTMAFFLGLAASFTFMGAAATLVGGLVRGYMTVIVRGAGLVIIILGALSLVGKGFSGHQFQDRPAATFAGSFIYGASFSIGWSACVGPILAGILVMAATQEKALAGMFLLFIYAMGLGLPLILLSLFFNRLNREGLFWKMIKGKGWDLSFAGKELHVHSNNLISGLLFIVLGTLMVSDTLSFLNRLIPIEAQMWYGRLEERLMEILK